MEGATLFNQGFLGAGGFHWWIGQIADDSTWRDNISASKVPSVNQIPGWGYRYKVRIIGYHDREEATIPSDQLPWAQVMYPITGGGGQAKAGQTPNLRQGMFVFGFFLDGADAQNPVIMGVLGNNPQTPLGTTIGNDKSNYGPTSGFAQGTNPDPNIKPPDNSLKTEKPTPPGTPSTSLKPGVVLDKYGRDPSRPPTSRELAAAQSARTEADKLGLTGEARERLIAEATVAATKQEAAEKQSPISPNVPGTTWEDVAGVHLLTAADVIRNDLYIKKTTLSSPCKDQKSDLKNIQVAIENLTNDINKIQQAATSYIDAVSNKLSNVQNLIDNASSQISAFMKSIFDQVRGYVLKELNARVAPTIDKLFPNQRNQLMDLKDRATDTLSCVFNKIIGTLTGLIGKFLGELFQDPADPTGNTIRQLSPVPNSFPVTPICSVEQLTGNILGNTLPDLTSEIDKVLAPISNFISDNLTTIGQLGGGLGLNAVTGALSGDSLAGNLSTLISGQINPAASVASNATNAATSVLSQATSLIGGITGNLTSALGFINAIVSFFTCDDDPSCPANDHHTLQNGGGATEQPEEPNNTSVAVQAENPKPATPTTEIPFATPARDTADLKVGESNAETTSLAEQETALQLF